MTNISAPEAPTLDVNDWQCAPLGSNSIAPAKREWRQALIVETCWRAGMADIVWMLEHTQGLNPDLAEKIVDALEYAILGAANTACDMSEALRCMDPVPETEHDAEALLVEVARAAFTDSPDGPYPLAADPEKVHEMRQRRLVYSEALWAAKDARRATWRLDAQ